MSSTFTVHSLFLLLLLLLFFVIKIKADDPDDYSSTTDDQSTAPNPAPPTPSSPIPPLRHVLAILRYSYQLYIFFGPPEVTATTSGAGPDWPFLHVVPQSSLDFSRSSGQLLLAENVPLRAASIWTGLSGLSIFEEMTQDSEDDDKVHLKVRRSYAYIDHTDYSDAATPDDDDHYLVEACFEQKKSDKPEQENAYSCAQLNLVNKCSLVSEPKLVGADQSRFKDAAFLSSATEEKTFFVVLDALKDDGGGDDDDEDFTTTITKVRAKVTAKLLESAPCTQKSLCLNQLEVVDPGTMTICELQTEKNSKKKITLAKECPDGSTAAHWRVSTGYVDESKFLLVDNLHGTVRYFDRALYNEEDSTNRKRRDDDDDDDDDDVSSTPSSITTRTGPYVEVTIEKFFFGEGGRGLSTSAKTKLIVGLLLTVVLFLFAFWCLCCDREKDGMFTTNEGRGCGGGDIIKGGGKDGDVKNGKGDGKEGGGKKKEEELSGKKAADKVSAKKKTDKTKKTKQTDKTKNTTTTKTKEKEKTKKKKTKVTGGSEKSKKSKSKKSKTSKKSKKSKRSDKKSKKSKKSAKTPAVESAKKSNKHSSKKKKVSVRTEPTSKTTNTDNKGGLTKASDFLPAGLSKSIPSIRSEVDEVPATPVEKSAKSKKKTKKQTSAKGKSTSKKEGGKKTPAPAAVEKTSKKKSGGGGGGKTSKKSSKKSKPALKGLMTTGKGKAAAAGGIIPGPPKAGKGLQKQPVKKGLPKGLFKAGKVASGQTASSGKDSDVSAAGKERGPSD